MREEWPMADLERSSMIERLSGECLCGHVRFVANGTINRVSACYCSQCTRQNGGGPFYGAELHGELILERQTTLRWYAASDKASRGFCGRCGSSMFWKTNADPTVFDVSLGTLDDTGQLNLDAHIFVDNCPSYLPVAETAPHLTEEQVVANTHNCSSNSQNP